MTRAAIYARVSTDDQDEARQIEDCREALDDHPYEIESADVYADIMTGTTTEREGFRDLVDDVADDQVDLVIATEISRLSRSGAQDVMEFITHCLEHDVSVEFTQSPVAIRTEMNEVTQSIQRLIVSLLSELANIEHKQKMERIESGIRSAQKAGKWTGRPPRGFTVDEHSKALRVDVPEFLNTREALERVVSGEPIGKVAESSGIPASTLRTLRDDRLDLFFRGVADDDRVDEALDDVRPLDEPDVDVDPDEIDELRDRIGELESALQKE